jgi:tRNA A37 threonylcarbamoyladenosine dehydratase
LSEESIGKNRLSETISKLKELNDECDIKEHTKEISEEFLSQFTVNFNFFQFSKVVVYTDSHFTEIQEVAEICHKKGIVFISALTAGLCSAAFVDVGLLNFFNNF